MEDKYKGISQTVVGHWLWNSAINDPIILDIKNISIKDETDINDVYSAALLCIKKFRFDDVLTIVEALVKDDQITDPILKAKIILLASRFNFYHNFRTKALEMVLKFEDVWNELGMVFYLFLLGREKPTYLYNKYNIKFFRKFFL